MEISKFGNLEITDVPEIPEGRYPRVVRKVRYHK